jgi:regulator of protease activity HflC (stomatin/prohibitin superfamily)
MGWFILAIIIWLVALIAFAATPFSGESKAGPAAVGVVAVILGFLVFTVSGLKSVPVKNIGVPQSFGKVGTSVYQPGIHETWTPWLHLTDIDETVQTTTYEDTGNDSGSSCNGGLLVRIGGQQTACADVTIQWQIKPAAAGALFSDYANQGNFMTTVTDAVVVRELKTVVNNVLGDYNPITDVENVTNSNSSTSEFTTFSAVIKADMQKDIGSEVDVKAVLMPELHYDSAIESKLAAIQQAYANYAVAEENVKVNEENATALQKLGTPSGSQLAAECLTDLKDGMSAPAGFQCLPGTGSALSLSSGS